MAEIALLLRPPSVEEYARFRADAGWSEVDPADLEGALSRSLYAAVLERDGEAVAMVRVVGDGGPYLYIQDLIVLAPHRGAGLGHRLMRAAMAWVDDNAAAGTFVGLMAASGTEAFYRRYGFEPRRADAPGMSRSIVPTDT